MNSTYLNIAFVMYFLATVFYCVGLFFRNKFLPLLGRVFILSGVLSLTLYAAMRWQVAGRPPLSNMFESLVIFAWAIGLVLLFIDLRYKIKSVSGLTALLGLLSLGYASFLDKELTPLLPALKSNWLTIHVLTCFIGYAGLTVGFIASAVILFKQKEIAKLDTIAHKVIAFGFLFLTLGIITGAVWANSAWGTYWSWDPKETWSLVTWFIYAIYLHIRFTKGWKEQKAAWLAVIGFLAMLFTYFGVNYLLSGLHSYG
ncbi:MAG: cytochrome c biogenesis protein CcsA [Candidatus Omnitrophota bacterium]|nr:cytochrome c biogenesis protein CcsA [Candidatus Omnitrophota bacterium]